MKYLLLFLLFGNSVNGQDSLNEKIRISNVPLTHYIGGLFNEHFFGRYNIGERDVCWLKINIATGNKITRVTVSPGTNQKLVEFFKESLLDVDSKLKISKDVFSGMDSISVIIPVEYYLHGEGEIKKVDNDDFELVKYLTAHGKAEKIYLFPQIQCINIFMCDFDHY